MDMWEVYLTASHIWLLPARIVYDKFHVSQELNQAIDLIRRKEHQALIKRAIGVWEALGNGVNAARATQPRTQRTIPVLSAQ